MDATRMAMKASASMKAMNALQAMSATKTMAETLKTHSEPTLSLRSEQMLIGSYGSHAV